MRHIKFRVWDGKKYHFPECDLDKTNHYLQIGSSGIFFLHNAEGEYIAGSKDGGILEQYTGLKDKNYKEICEGDICRLGSGIDVKIIYEYGGFGYRIHEEWKGYFIGFAGHNNLSKVLERIEVIGNIHENPELLR